jgi:hypothetical protein
MVAKSLGSGFKAANDSPETKFLSYSFPKIKKGMELMKGFLVETIFFSSIYVH